MAKRRNDRDFHRAADKMRAETRQRKARAATQSSALDDVVAATEGAMPTYELVDPGSVLGHEAYVLLEALVGQCHEHLDADRVALAWHYGLTPDADGRLVLGRCKKASDLDRELHAWDFVILLNHDFWQAATAEQRAALLDHELSHTAPKLDPKTGEHAVDARGRKKFRTRRHDIEEFTAVIERHGIYRSDLERFAEALRKAQAAPLFAGVEE